MDAAAPLVIRKRRGLRTWTDWCGADVTTLTDQIREHLKLGAVKDETEVLRLSPWSCAVNAASWPI